MTRVITIQAGDVTVRATIQRRGEYDSDDFIVEVNALADKIMQACASLPYGGAAISDQRVKK